MIAPAGKNDLEEVQKVEIWDARLTAWTENEFQQAANAIAASGIKFSKRKIQGCHQVLVQQKSASEANKELGLFGGSIQKAIPIFVDFRINPLSRGLLDG